MSNSVQEEKKQQTSNIWETEEWKELEKEVSNINKTHLRDLLSTQGCEERNKALTVEYENITFDGTRQRVTTDILNKLIALAKKADVSRKIEGLFTGKKINITENRRVLHTALRTPRDVKLITDDNINQTERVWKVLDQIKTFSEKVRNGTWKGYSGKPLKNVISIGIGGSYLGCEFVYESLKTHNESMIQSEDRILRFYANIDPIGFIRAVKDLDPEETLIIIVSKSFKTRETLMNGTLAREWLVNGYKGDNKCLTQHFVAVSANTDLPQKEFGVAKENIFEFWDWVGGRYSVTSAVGILPLALHFGFDIMEQFLKGTYAMDCHFRTTEFSKNIPLLMGLFGVWNSSFLGYSTRALIPYCEALCRLPAHIQQLDMESNGKSVDLNNKKVPFKTGEINFGESGTNSQHSFFQLIHQGRTIPVDFIGFCKSQLFYNKYYINNKNILNKIKDNHDELMSNIFAQSDALALGKTKEELIKEKVKESIIPHKEFSGNRPSSILLFKNELNPYQCGQILSLFEHRTVVQGFIWNLGSFDQWGVELGKIMGKKFKNSIESFRNGQKKDINDYNTSTNFVLNTFLKNSKEE